MPPLTREVGTAWGVVLVGGIVAVAIAPWDSYFLPNFLWYWLPHMCILFPMWLLRTRPAALAGTATVLALYLGAFDLWVLAQGHFEGLAWLGYLFSLPGAMLGALLATVWLRDRDWTAVWVGLATAGLVLTGLTANQFIVCNTVMSCGL